PANGTWQLYAILRKAPPVRNDRATRRANGAFHRGYVSFRSPVHRRWRGGRVDWPESCARQSLIGAPSLFRADRLRLGVWFRRAHDLAHGLEATAVASSSCSGVETAHQRTRLGGL